MSGDDQPMHGLCDEDAPPTPRQPLMLECSYQLVEGSGNDWLTHGQCDHVGLINLDFFLPELVLGWEGATSPVLLFV